jgi:lipopolysaccharide/colanic/teichoic acid biosynthesis glycosyltransferase/nucleoside-diphosphate-sugar epimerase
MSLFAPIDPAASSSGKILVTGASGFVGRALCAEAIRRALPVRAAVRESCAWIPPGCECARIDGLSAETDWSGALRGVSTVIHLAARVHVMREDAADPLAAFRAVNAAGTERLARQAVECGVKRLVFVASVKVVGEATSGEAKFSESDPPMPRDAYGISKWEAEQALWKIARHSALEGVVVRPPLVYGAGVKGNFAALVAALRWRWPLPFASVDNARSLIYVGNLVDALLLCAEHPAAAGRTYLVCDGEDLSTPGLLRRLGKAMGKPPRLWPCPPGLLRTMASAVGQGIRIDRLLGSLRVDAARIRRELGWSPPYSVDEGLAASVEAHGNAPAKRLLDLCLAVLAAIVLCLPVAALFLLVKATSPGPALYWSDRVGRHNRLFRMPKFRSMRIDTPAVATHLLGDPASWLTPPGSFLRRTSLDELPQLWSIIKGDMSFVGPRPALFNQHDLIELRTRHGVHALVPGLTGWAQINGRDELPIPRKVALDVEYLQRRSLALDCRILALTALKVLRREGVSH